MESKYHYGVYTTLLRNRPFKKKKWFVSNKWEQEGKTDGCDMDQYQRVCTYVTITRLDLGKENHNRSIQRVKFYLFIYLFIQ